MGSKLENNLGVHEKGQEFKDAIDYLEKNKRLLVTGDKVKEAHIFGDHEELPRSIWYFGDGENNKLFRFFDDDLNIMEIDISYGNLCRIYDKNNKDYGGLDDNEKYNLMLQKFKEEIMALKFDFNIGKDFRDNANEFIEENKQQ